MPKVTDTRAKVRELAQKITDGGGTPTPTLIRQMLGKGSPNTIVDELRAWQAERQQPLRPAEHTAAALERVGMGELAELLKQAVQHSDRQHALLGQAAGLVELAEKVPDALRVMGEQVTRLTDTLISDRKWMEREIAAINARYEGVQKHMLLQVNEAREESVRWKAKFVAVRDELGTWRSTMQQKTTALRDEVNMLRGKLGMEPAPPLEFDVKPAASPVRTGNYGGHPRALAFDDAE